MENIDTLLIIFGVLLALIVASWTIWSHRKEKSRVFSNSFSSQPQPKPSFGQENLSSVATSSEPNFGSSPIADPIYQAVEQASLQQEEVQQDVETRLSGIRVRLQNQPESQNQSQRDIQQNVEQTTLQPNIQVQIQQSEPEPKVEQTPPQTNQMKIYVMANAGQTFAGNELVKQLENLGLLYGDFNLFHRHIDGTSASPVVYSVANAYNPGVFDLAQMNQLTTGGVIFFMYLPSTGNDLVNFNQLLSDARELAQALGGWVVDDQQKIFDEDSRYRYLAQLRQSH